MYRSVPTLHDPSKTLTIIVFAWNFFDEISKNLASILREKREEILFLVPFPTPRLIRVAFGANDDTVNVETLREHTHQPTAIPNPITYSSRPKAVMVTHQRNEELLMPFFILHHAPMFDKVHLIDYNSDDRTLEIVRKYAPPSWEVVPSHTGSTFDAQKVDQEIMEIEKKHSDDWAIALTTTEFLVRPQFRQYLAETFQGQGTTDLDESFISRIPIHYIIANNKRPLVYSRPLPEQRKVCEFYNMVRFLHYKTSSTYFYTPGRHD